MDDTVGDATSVTDRSGMLVPVLFPCVRMGLRVRPERRRVVSSWSFDGAGGLVVVEEEEEEVEAVGAVERKEDRLPNGKGMFAVHASLVKSEARCSSLSLRLSPLVSQ
jgi:hypothetical protein